MNYRATDYILPVLAPLIVYIIIMMGFIVQYQHSQDEKARYQLVEKVNQLYVDAVRQGTEAGDIEAEIRRRQVFVATQEQAVNAFTLHYLDGDSSTTNSFVNDAEKALLSQTTLHLSALTKPIFLKSSHYWHYISPISAEKAVLFSLDRQHSRFAWYNDQTFIGRVTVLTLTVILLMLFAFRRYLKISIDQAKEIQQQQVDVRTREITLMHRLTSEIHQTDCLTQAAQIIRAYLPEILPSYSGTILFVQKDKKALKPHATWGINSSQTTKVLFTSAWFNKAKKKKENEQYYQIKNRALTIALTDGESPYGVLHLIHDRVKVTKANVENILKFVGQLNIALINLQLKNDLKEKVIRDPLTNLYNRRFLSESLEKSLSGAIRYKSALAVLMVDLDYFKQLNDSYGHEAGDRVLVAVARVFEHNLRLSDIACRYGGEEFCIICPDTNLREAFLLAEKLRELIETLTIVHRQQSIQGLTASIGIALYPRNGASAEGLLNQADDALYKAKSLGRNMVLACEEAPKQSEQVLHDR